MRRKHRDHCYFACLMVCLVLTLAMLGEMSRAAMPEITRSGGTAYLCRDSAGELPDSGHNEWQAAVTVCGAKAEQYGRVFTLIPGAEYVITPSEVDPDEPPDEPVDPPDEPVEPIDPDAPLAEFSVTATGFNEAWPVNVAEAMNRESGRVEISVTPDAIGSGNYNFAAGARWEVKFWGNSVHGTLVPQGDTLDDRLIWRLEDDQHEPLIAVVAGEAIDITVSWTPEGLGIFVASQLRLYLTGQFERATNMHYGSSGELAVAVYAEPLEFDTCQNVDEWGTVQDVGAGENSASPAPVPDECLEDEDDVQTSGVLRWAAPTKWTDGRALPPEDISGFRIYEDELGEHNPLAAVVSGDVREHEMPPGCYRMTAVADGRESVLSKNRGCLE